MQRPNKRPVIIRTKQVKDGFPHQSAVVLTECLLALCLKAIRLTHRLNFVAPTLVVVRSNEPIEELYRSKVTISGYLTLNRRSKTNVCRKLKHTDTHTDMHTRTHAHTHTCTHVCTHHARMHACLHACTHAQHANNVAPSGRRVRDSCNFRGKASCAQADRLREATSEQPAQSCPTDRPPPSLG